MAIDQFIASFSPILPGEGWQMLCLLLGFLFCFMCGIAPLHEWSWRRRAVRAEAAITDLTQREVYLPRCGNVQRFFPVYRYTLSTGTYEVIPKAGHPTAKGIAKGTIAPVLVSPDRPYEARLAHKRFFDIVDIGFLTLGGWLLEKAYTGFPLTPLMPSLTVLALALICWNICRQSRPLFIDLLPAEEAASGALKSGGKKLRADEKCRAAASQFGLAVQALERQGPVYDSRGRLESLEMTPCLRYALPRAAHQGTSWTLLQRDKTLGAQLPNGYLVEAKNITPQLLESLRPVAEEYSEEYFEFEGTQGEVAVFWVENGGKKEVERIYRTLLSLKDV
jgi:hypothetical protein